MATKQAAKPAPSVRSIDDFRSAHDRSFIVPKKIKEALASLGADGWAYEGEFMKMAQISTTELGFYREKFEAHVVQLRGANHNGKRAWAGTKATADKMRKMLS